MLRLSGTTVNMPTLVQHAFNESQLLTIPNIGVVVRAEARLTILGENNYQEDGGQFPKDTSPQTLELFASITKSLEKRDWRKLRETLINLNFEDMSAVCEWLGSAGYVPQAMLDEPNALYFTGQDVRRMSAKNLGWQPDFATQGIRLWLRRYRDVFAWLMSLGNQQFRNAIRAAREFLVNRDETSKAEILGILHKGRKPKLKQPDAMFLKEIGAPSGLDTNVLAGC
jgi:hypothetical protein